MPKKIIFITVFLKTFLFPLAGSISICLTWSQNDNNLQFVCSVNELHLSVTLLDPSNRELALCLPQYFQDNCFQHESGVNITQNLFTNETVFSVDKNTYSNINGNWTCQHGFYGDTASVTVNICSCDTDQNTSVLPVFAWTLAGSGILYWILVFFGTFIKITVGRCWKICNGCTKTINSRTKKYKPLRCVVLFIFPTIPVTFGVVLAFLSIRDFKESVARKTGFVLFGIASALLFITFSIILQGVLRQRSNKHIDDINFKSLKHVTDSENPSRKTKILER